jgi:hypothetical protein
MVIWTRCSLFLISLLRSRFYAMLGGGSGDGNFLAVVMLRVIFRRWFCYMGVSPIVVIAHGFCVFATVIVSLLSFGDVWC